MVIHTCIYSIFRVISRVKVDNRDTLYTEMYLALICLPFAIQQLSVITSELKKATVMM